MSVARSPQASTVRTSTARTSTVRTGSEDGLAKAIELVLTPALFAAAGFGLDRWWGTGPWLALSFGMFAFVLKLLVEWYRYAERMQLHEQEVAARRPAKQRGIDRAAVVNEPASLPLGVSLDTGLRDVDVATPSATEPSATAADRAVPS